MVCHRSKLPVLNFAKVTSKTLEKTCECISEPPRNNHRCRSRGR